MLYVVNNHLNNLYVLSNKAWKKNSKLINVGPTSIPEARVGKFFLPESFSSSESWSSSEEIEESC